MKGEKFLPSSIAIKNYDQTVETLEMVGLDPPPMTPAVQTASEYLSMHVYPTLEPVFVADPVVYAARACSHLLMLLPMEPNS